MKIFFEEYQYEKAVVSKYIHERYFVTLKRSEKVKIPYVGYYHNSKCGDSVFILPKVFINVLKDKDSNIVEKAFGVFNPEDIIDTKNEKNPLLNTVYFEDVYNLSTWIYRAIDRYRERNEENITEIVDIQNVKNSRGERSQTWVDIILALVRFSREHRNLFTYIARINSQANKRINWRKTISHFQPFLQDGSPVYMQFLNKTKTFNFDEELLVLFYSVLEYLHEKYHFRVVRNVQYQIDTRYVDRLIKSQKGSRLLKSIRKKYFKDELVDLWNLLYVFFDKSEQVEAKGNHEEALMIKNFNLVFEDMIDSLLNDDTKKNNANLADQPDGKIVDHIYRYRSLILADDDIYYIGDSKYYKKNEIDDKSIYKQFTYAKNVIQLNMELTQSENGEQRPWRERYFDKKTEGYNISPNFFIRGIVKAKHNEETALDIDQTNLDLEPEMGKDGKMIVKTAKHHNNRLFDRDTLFVQQYSVNFLYVLSAYALSVSDRSKKNVIYKEFRNNIMKWLSENYSFFVLKPKESDLETMLNKHFRLLLGKVFAFNETSIILGMQSQNMNRNDDVQNDLYEVYTAIHNDFEFRKYNIVNSTIGEEYLGERISSLDEDKEVVDYFEELIKFNPQLINQKLWVNLIENFGKKYWGMTERDWIKLIDSYRFETTYQNDIRMAANIKEER